MNRAIDKPGEHVQVGGSDGGPIVIQWLRDTDGNEQVLLPGEMATSEDGDDIGHAEANTNLELT